MQKKKKKNKQTNKQQQQKQKANTKVLCHAIKKKGDGFE